MERLKNDRESLEIAILSLRVAIPKPKIARTDAESSPARVRISRFPLVTSRFSGKQGGLALHAAAERSPQRRRLLNTKHSFVPHTHVPTKHRPVRPQHAQKGFLTMPNAKRAEEKLERMLNAWEALAPDKSFGGMTLAQFKTAVAPSQTTRQQIDNLNNQMTQALAARDAADEAFAAKAQLVVNGVLADPTEGPDSALYAALGYTRRSERRTGLTRKRNQPAAK